jgi:hypothetical protein
MHQAMRLRNMISIASVLCSVVAIRATTASATLGEQAESVAIVDSRAIKPPRGLDCPTIPAMKAANSLEALLTPLSRPY